MRKIRLSEAKANLSRIVDEAARGEPAIITRHGRGQAVILGYEEWQRLSRVRPFGRLLMSNPIEANDLPARDITPPRDVELLIALYQRCEVCGRCTDRRAP